MGRALINMTGKTFGPMKIICLWGVQSGNLAWIYWCRNCGSVSKRLGTTFRNGQQGTKCPACLRSNSRGSWACPKPETVMVEILMQSKPPEQHHPRCGVLQTKHPAWFTKRLERCSTEELHYLNNAVVAEIAKRK